MRIEGIILKKNPDVIHYFCQNDEHGPSYFGELKQKNPKITKYTGDRKILLTFLDEWIQMKFVDQLSDWLKLIK